MKLMVRNLPAALQEPALHELFSNHGECTVTLQNVSRRQDCTAIVTYKDGETAKTALRELGNQQFGGSQITVEEVADSAPLAPPSPHNSPSKPRSRSHSPAKDPASLTTPTDPAQPSPAKVDSPPAKLAELSSEADETKNEGKVGERKEGEKGKKQDFAVEEDGSKFKILSTNKRNEELSSWKCLACNRKIQKKSVKAHIASKTHKQHIS